MRSAFAPALVVTVAVSLAACSQSGVDELTQWMAEQRAEVKPRVEPLTPPKQFVPQEYTQAASVEPFNPQKLTQVLRSEASQPSASAALIGPELARRKEPLEAYPLDSVAMVGSLLQQGRPVALVRIDNLIHQVRPGNYLGQNFGRVLRVNETQIELREIVQDATGEWVERLATLQLQEKTR
jgi:type IV pilus assembly protein PilP